MAIVPRSDSQPRVLSEERYAKEETRTFPFVITIIKRISALPFADLITLAESIDSYCWKDITEEIDFQKEPSEQQLGKADKIALCIWSFVKPFTKNGSPEKRLKEELAQSLAFQGSSFSSQCSISQIIAIARAIDDMNGFESNPLPEKISAFFTCFKTKIMNQKKLSADEIAWAAFASRKVRPLPSYFFVYLRNQWLFLHPTVPRAPREICIMAKAFTQTFTRLQDTNPRPDSTKNLDDKFLAWSGAGVPLEPTLGLYEDLGRWIERTSDRMDAVDVNHGIWSYAYLKWREVLWEDQNGRPQRLNRNHHDRVDQLNNKVINALLEPTIRNLSEANEDYFSKIYWSAQRLSCRESILLGKIYERIRQDAGKFTPPQLTTLFHSLVNTHSSDQDTLKQLIVEISVRGGVKFPPKELVKITQAMLIPYCSSDHIGQIVGTYLQMIINYAPKPEWKDEELSQINTIYHFYRLKTNNPEKIILPPKLQEEIDAALKNNKPMSSRFHEIVAEEIRSLGRVKPFVMEHKFYSFSIDIAFVTERVAVEVDGPDHYVGKTQTLKPKEEIKKSMLRMEGWVLVRIPYFVWNDEIDKKKYLKTNLPPQCFE